MDLKQGWLPGLRLLSGVDAGAGVCPRLQQSLQHQAVQPGEQGIGHDADPPGIALAAARQGQLGADLRPGRGTTEHHPPGIQAEAVGMLVQPAQGLVHLAQRGGVAGVAA